ncbi:hypothetical protein NPIL_609201 [Nephila pilipes]|uniref:Uncharacterized protein n=1 Tax=Nephila pilipes TaxID=299642 RepID=A0A8X6SZS4_NEPPI|nr:hypothetical protein NPIL_609201 [Nephila pilipes]
MCGKGSICEKERPSTPGFLLQATERSEYCIYLYIMAYLLKLKKDDMIEITKELRIEAQNTFTKVEIMNRIIQSESYEEEIIKAVMEGVLEEKREKMALKERRQIREFELQ